MTTIDTSIPYEELLMICDSSQLGDKTDSEKLRKLSEGLRWVETPSRYRKEWAALMTRLKFFEHIEQAEKAWDAMQQSDPELFEKSFYLIEDESHQLAGACALWPGHHIENLPWRLHYLGVSPDHQRKGLAGILVDQVISEHFSRNDMPLYLSTQAQSWPAVLLYMRHGFKPYTSASVRHTKEQNEQAWNNAFALLEKAGSSNLQSEIQDKK